MQFVARIVVSVFLLTSALGSAYHNGAKLRRDGVLNLYPFPRVGRANHRTWQVPLNDFYLEEYEPVDKRQLYAFPRVGRGGGGGGGGGVGVAGGAWGDPLRAELQAVPVPSRRNDGPGMWFGPRLGRSVKGDDDEIVMQNEQLEQSEPEQLEPEQHLERKKRQSRPHV